MKNEIYSKIIRTIVDEKSDKVSLDKIIYACEQQINIIEYESKKYQDEENYEED